MMNKVCVQTRNVERIKINSETDVNWRKRNGLPANLGLPRVIYKIRIDSCVRSTKFLTFEWQHHEFETET